MKTLILIIGALLIALNTLVGLIVSGYDASNYLLSDLSIALSASMIYFVSCSTMSDGFKIGLSFLFISTGIARFLCIAFSPAVWENNLFVIVAAGVLVVEMSCVAGAWFANKK